MPGSGGIVPLVIDDFLATQKTDRMIPSRGPERKSSGCRQTLNYVRVRRFLKDHEIRRNGFNDFRQRQLTAHSTKSDVVTE
jgi:hypothetical protein